MRGLLIVLILFAAAEAGAQENPWKLLRDVEVENKFDESVGYQVEYPVFGPKARALNGEEITIKGYMIPYEVYLGPKYFILSALPVAACFFCGGAGPETVMEVYTEEEVEISQDRVTVTGKLSLNEDDPNHMMYVLKEAKVQ